MHMQLVIHVDVGTALFLNLFQHIKASGIVDDKLLISPTIGAVQCQGNAATVDDLL